MDLNKLMLSLFLSLQIISTVFLWSLNPTDIVSETKFAIFLAVDLLSFAMVAYSYRKLSWGQMTNSNWILLGSLGLVMLLLSSIFFP